MWRYFTCESCATAGNRSVARMKGAPDANPCPLCGVSQWHEVGRPADARECPYCDRVYPASFGLCPFCEDR